MSLGPERVTDRERAEERAEERARRQVEEPPKKKKKVILPEIEESQAASAPPKKKKKKAISPELAERQKRALARMLELGVPQLQVKIYFLLLFVYNVWTA